MALRSDWSDRACPIARGIDMVGDPWVLLVIRELLSGVRRFDEIRSALGVSDKVLANRLHGMVDEGLVERLPSETGRADRFEYFPTQASADALPILHAYAVWAGQHATSGDKPPLVIVCRTCGDESRRGESCSECGAVLGVGNVAWIRPLAIDRRPKSLTGPPAS